MSQMIIDDIIDTKLMTLIEPLKEPLLVFSNTTVTFHVNNRLLKMIKCFFLNGL